MKRTQRKSEQARTRLLYEAQVLLAKPAVVGHWHTALERANEFTALLGMKPEIRREDGSRIIEEGNTFAMGAKFSFTLPDDRRLIRSHAQTVINGATLEEALQQPINEDEIHWLSEDELAQLLETLHLTEGWTC